MKLTAFLDSQKRGIYLSRIKKRTNHLFCHPNHTIPVFIFGIQRSGTSMIMNSFHLHPDIEVFDESKNNLAFLDHRIRGFETLKGLIRNCKYPFVCFKPLADSHLIDDFMNNFQKGKFIWIYRDYRDVANSHIRKFSEPTRAIRIVCNNQEGGGWFQEGISNETGKILRDLHRLDLSEFDFACLVWLARNRIFIEKKLITMPNLILIRYEDMVTAPRKNFAFLLKFLKMRNYRMGHRYMHKNSISKNPFPKINSVVMELCDDLMAELNAFAQSPGSKNSFKI